MIKVTLIAGSCLVISLISLSCLPQASEAAPPSKESIALKSKIIELGNAITWKQCDEWNALNEEYGKLTTRKVKMSPKVKEACAEAANIHEQIMMTVVGTTKSIEDNETELESVKGLVSLLKSLEAFKHHPEMGEEFAKAVQQSGEIAKGLEELKKLSAEINELINSSNSVEERLFELDNDLRPILKKGLEMSPEEEEHVKKGVADMENVLKEWHGSPLEGLAPAYNGVLLSAKELLEEKAAQKPAEEPKSEEAAPAEPEVEAEDEDDEEEEEDEDEDDDDDDDEDPQMKMVKQLLPPNIPIPSQLPTRMRGHTSERSFHNKRMRVN